MSLVERCTSNTGPADRPEPPGRDRGTWTVRVPLAALDHRTNGGLGHRFAWALLVLEGFCRDKAYCWYGNARLAAALGCDVATLKRLLRDMERAGLIHRVPTTEGRPGRQGIVLLKRADPDLPVAEPAGLADAVALLRGARKCAPSRGAETRPRSRTLDWKDDEDVNVIRAGGGNPDPEAEDPCQNFGKGKTRDAIPDPEAVPEPEDRENLDEPPPVSTSPAMNRMAERPSEPAPEPLEPATPPEVLIVDPAAADATTGIQDAHWVPPAPVTDPAIATVGTGTVVPTPAPPPPPEADPTPSGLEISDPVPTPEAIEAEIADLEAKIARQAPRPPSAMQRIRLKNLRDMRDGTWRADSLVVDPPQVPPAATPRMSTWPSAVGPVETETLLRRLPGAGPAAVEEAARRVADRLGDSHSVAWYRRAFARVATGEIPVQRALSAWKMARSGTANCPGAVFNNFLKGGDRCS